MGSGLAQRALAPPLLMRQGSDALSEAASKLVVWIPPGSSLFLSDCVVSLNYLVLWFVVELLIHIQSTK